MAEIITRRIDWLLVTSAGAPVHSFESAKEAEAWANEPVEIDGQPVIIDGRKVKRIDRYDSLTLQKIISTKKVLDVSEFLSERSKTARERNVA